jgi:hypothetical protein
MDLQLLLVQVVQVVVEQGVPMVETQEMPEQLTLEVVVEVLQDNLEVVMMVEMVVAE